MPGRHRHRRGRSSSSSSSSSSSDEEHVSLPSVRALASKFGGSAHREKSKLKGKLPHRHRHQHSQHANHHSHPHEGSRSDTSDRSDVDKKKASQHGKWKQSQSPDKKAQQFHKVYAEVALEHQKELSHQHQHQHQHQHEHQHQHQHEHQHSQSKVVYVKAGPGSTKPSHEVLLSGKNSSVQVNNSKTRKSRSSSESSRDGKNKGARVQTQKPKNKVWETIQRLKKQNAQHSSESSDDEVNLVNKNQNSKHHHHSRRSSGSSGDETHPNKPPGAVHTHASNLKNKVSAQFAKVRKGKPESTSGSSGDKPSAYAESHGSHHVHLADSANTGSLQWHTIGSQTSSRSSESSDNGTKEHHAHQVHHSYRDGVKHALTKPVKKFKGHRSDSSSDSDHDKAPNKFVQSLHTKKESAKKSVSSKMNKLKKSRRDSSYSSSSDDEVFTSQVFIEPKMQSKTIPRYSDKPSNTFFGVKLRSVNAISWGVTPKRNLSFGENLDHSTQSAPVSLNIDSSNQKPISFTKRNAGSTRNKVLNKKLGDNFAPQYHSQTDLSFEPAQNAASPWRRKSVSDHSYEPYQPATLTRKTSISDLLKLYRTKSQTDLSQTTDLSINRQSNINQTEELSSSYHPVPVTVPMKMSDLKLVNHMANQKVEPYTHPTKDIVRLPPPRPPLARSISVAPDVLVEKPSQFEKSKHAATKRDWPRIHALPGQHFNKPITFLRSQSVSDLSCTVNFSEQKIFKEEKTNNHPSKDVVTVTAIIQKVPKKSFTSSSSSSSEDEKHVELAVTHNNSVKPVPSVVRFETHQKINGHEKPHLLKNDESVDKTDRDGRVPKIVVVPHLANKPKQNTTKANGFSTTPKTPTEKDSKPIHFIQKTPIVHKVGTNNQSSHTHDSSSSDSYIDSEVEGLPKLSSWKEKAKNMINALNSSSNSSDDEDRTGFYQVNNLSPADPVERHMMVLKKERMAKSISSSSFEDTHGINLVEYKEPEHVKPPIKLVKPVVKPRITTQKSVGAIPAKRVPLNNSLKVTKAATMDTSMPMLIKQNSVAEQSSSDVSHENSQLKNHSNGGKQNGTSDSLANFDPYAIGRMIVRSSRKSASDVKQRNEVVPMENASVPQSSPFYRPSSRGRLSSSSSSSSSSSGR